VRRLRRWRAPPPHPADRPFPVWHQGLGETYHEAGVLWMGQDPVDSVTDGNARLHHIAITFARDQAALPTVCSVNPI